MDFASWNNKLHSEEISDVKIVTLDQYDTIPVEPLGHLGCPIQIPKSYPV
jgi:hypothetical protein